MDEEALRRELEHLLQQGLETEWRERAYTSEEVNRIVARLQAIRPDDYVSKLKVAGFTSQPYGAGGEIEQACETCMYFVIHRQFCELPELQIPVKPKWSCRLWRI
ncbi:hypothetical protein [Pelomicrobium methylotrophicum]|nr:hypothetical protein [Pelomicrobium methylotrophicum]